MTAKASSSYSSCKAASNFDKLESTVYIITLEIFLPLCILDSTVLSRTMTWTILGLWEL